MYLIVIVFIYILFAKYFVDWKRWQEFYPTILFYIVCNLGYNFIFFNHTLWMYRSLSIDWLTHTHIELIFTFLIIPVVIMIYLTCYPSKKQIFYIGVWVVFFSIVEYLCYKKGLFLYENGWNVTWSTIFNIIMFSLLRVHHRSPFWGIVLSLPVIAILLYVFHPLLTELK